MKAELLRLMKNDDRPAAAVEAVLNSGLLPDDLLQKFLDDLTERAIRRVLGLPGCSEWTGRASWDAWAIKRLHSKDKESVALSKATERIIALTTREARENWDRRTGQQNPTISAAVEVARLSLLPCGLALEAAKVAVFVAINADVATYRAIRLAPATEREQQYQDLLSLINSLPDEV